jgi:hypothetical protein
MEKRTFKATKVLLFSLAIFGFFASCTKVQIGDAPSSAIEDSYAASFYGNLISAGMSASDAALVSGYSGSSSSGLSSNLLSFNAGAQASDTAGKAKDSVSHAMAAVANNDYFTNASEKKVAVEIIAQAQFETIAELADEADISAIINEVAATLSSDLSETGLSGADLEGAIEGQGKGFAKGLLGSDVASSIHDDIIGEFSEGAVDGLLANPNLASSGVDLISALSQGLITEVGSGTGSSLTAESKGQIISEILNGIKNQINLTPALSDSDKESYVAEIWDSSNSSIGSINDPALVSNVESGVFSSDSELHIISVYEPVTSASGDATISIQPGSKPIVLAMLGFRNINWRLTGATSRVSKVILHDIGTQTVDTVDSSKVEHVSKDPTSYSFYGIRTGGSFYGSFDEPWVQALIVKLRQKTGVQAVSFQGAYTQNSFVVGDGLNAVGQLPALSFSRPWFYPIDYSGLDAYQSSGTSNIYVNLWLTGPLTASTTVRVWVENLTTSTSDIPAFDQIYTINAGSILLQAIIPFNQNNAITETKNFRVHIEPSDSLFNFQNSVDGIIHGGTGGGGGGGGGGGASSTTVRSKYVSVSLDGVTNMATLHFSHVALNPMACMNDTYSYDVVLDNSNPLNSAFLSAYPTASNQWLSVTLACPSAPVLSGTATYTYPSGCNVSAYAASTAPSPPMCF